MRPDRLGDGRRMGSGEPNVTASQIGVRRSAIGKKRTGSLARKCASEPVIVPEPGICKGQTPVRVGIRPSVAEPALPGEEQEQPGPGRATEQRRQEHRRTARPEPHSSERRRRHSKSQPEPHRSEHSCCRPSGPEPHRSEPEHRSWRQPEHRNRRYSRNHSRGGEHGSGGRGDGGSHSRCNHRRCNHRRSRRRRSWRRNRRRSHRRTRTG
jgi:hypothetical protein